MCYSVYKEFSVGMYYLQSNLSKAITNLYKAILGVPIGIFNNEWCICMCSIEYIS